MRCRGQICLSAVVTSASKREDIFIVEESAGVVESPADRQIYHMLLSSTTRSFALSSTGA